MVADPTGVAQICNLDRNGVKHDVLDHLFCRSRGIGRLVAEIHAGHVVGQDVPEIWLITQESAQAGHDKTYAVFSRSFCISLSLIPRDSLMDSVLGDEVPTAPLISTPSFGVGLLPEIGG